MKKSGQYLVETILIIPLLMLILLGILEFGLFYRNANVVEDIAHEAAVMSSRRFVTGAMTSNIVGDAAFNSAVQAAIDAVIKRKNQLGLTNLTFDYTDLGAAFGTRPYALYQMNSTETRIINGTSTPVATLIIDYRNPAQSGIGVQLVYQYKTLLVGASIPVFGAAPIVIIPRDIAISSTKIRQYLMY